MQKARRGLKTKNGFVAQPMKWQGTTGRGTKPVSGSGEPRTRGTRSGMQGLPRQTARVRKGCMQWIWSKSFSNAT